MSDSVTPRTIAHQTLLSSTISLRLLKFMSIESVMLSNHLILCCLLFLLLSTFLSIGVFSNESTLHITWPKYWSFSFSISPSNEYPGLISLRIDCFDLLALIELQNTLNGQSNLKKKKKEKLMISNWLTSDYITKL